MASPNLTELATTTIANFSEEIADNVSDNIALLYRLEQKGNIQMFDGGEKINQALMYAENGTGGWYSGYDTWDVSASEVLSTAQFDLKFYNVNVTISGEEMVKNASSKAKIYDLLKSRTKVAEKTAMNQVNAALFADGTGNSGKEIGGLQHIVADAPSSGTVGSIDGGTYTFWRNRTWDFSDNSLTASATTIQTAMNSLYLDLVRGKDAPDFWVTTQTYYGYYLASLQTNQRFTNDKMAQAGFVNLKFMGGDVFFDESCPASKMYALNTDYLHYRPVTGRNFSVKKQREPVNQDAIVVPLLWAGNLTCSNRRLQGVIKA